MPSVLKNYNLHEGLSCLRIERSQNFTPIEVTARDNEVYGFEINW